MPMRTFRLQRILCRVRLGDIDDSVDIEGNLFAGRAPVLIAEAVDVFAVVLGHEGVVTVGSRILEDLVLAAWIGDLCMSARVGLCTIASAIESSHVLYSLPPFLFPSPVIFSVFLFLFSFSFCFVFLAHRP